MNFLRLSDYLLSILFEDEEILAVDKPYGVNSHTNDSKVGNTDYIQDGLIEIFEKQLNRKLYIVHRLDRTTTGVIIFAKSPIAAKKYADFFFQRLVKKNYLFVTASKPPESQFFVEKGILHKGKELDASTQLSRLKQSTHYDLWQAHPLTGRNHQIRIHAQAAGISILGDEKYDGKTFPFLCLHNQQIVFPNGLMIRSSPPPYFDNLELLDNQVLAKALFETDRRVRLFSMKSEQKKELQDQCFRLVHNKNDFKDLGFTIDHFGKILVLSCYQDTWTKQDEQIFSYFSAYMNQPVIVRLMHNRGKDPLNKSQFVIEPGSSSSGEQDFVESRWIAMEKEIKYELRSDSGQSFGLFLDQRLQRNWVYNHSQGRKVLNLFSYTCGFSVAAALGQASQVTSVDTSKAVLNWGKRNFEINQLDSTQHLFLCRDSLDFMAQIVRKKIQYDLIICDPPSFSRGEKGVFKIEDCLETLLKNCLECLTDDGDLLFSTNFEGFFIDDIRKIILKVKKQMNLAHLQINCIQSGLDFELAGQGPILKSFLVRKGRNHLVQDSADLTTRNIEFDEN